MDKSWDSDFEGDIRIPESIRSASDSIRNETLAARELAQLTSQLRAVLLTDPIDIPKPLLLRAMAIVRASTTDTNDAVYKSKAWENCKSDNLVVAGDSIEDVLVEAIKIRDEIIAYKN